MLTSISSKLICRLEITTKFSTTRLGFHNELVSTRHKLYPEKKFKKINTGSFDEIVGHHCDKRVIGSCSAYLIFKIFDITFNGEL